MFIFLIGNVTGNVCTVSLKNAEIVSSFFYIILLDGIIPRDVIVVDNQRARQYTELILEIGTFVLSQRN